MTPAEILRGLPKRAEGDALWLLSSLLRCSKSELLLRARDPLSAEQAKTWGAWWRRRERGEPLQYIAGTAPFYGREFLVNPHVLIPRPETERLVELTLERLKGFPRARVLDIGTGSGAIALTLRAERPDLEVVGSDVSAAALRVAQANAARLGLPVRFEKHDLFAPRLRRERWRLVVSNPPYLEFGKDKIARNVAEWEPAQALEPAARARVPGVAERAAWCGERILAACALAPPGITALELSPRVALFLERRWRRHPRVASLERVADLAGRKRFLLLTWRDG